jgi:hypothetical protein
MNIVIVGGGTAGWIAAYFISKAQPNQHSVTVVESSSIGIIGAGEGSTGTFISLLTGDFFDFKVDLTEFVQKTDATNKMGIRHTNWAPGAVKSYFAPLDASPTGHSLNDFIFKYVLHKFGNENIGLASLLGINYHSGNHSLYPAMHFDGHKVGVFFKEYCVKDGVKIVDSIVRDAQISSEGMIKNIVLEDGSTLEGDLFIDCTGFSRILMGKVDSKWVSKSDVLPVNTAMPFILKYSEGEQFVPETTATALSSGWMWDIPLSTRRGCGYVFDSNFITPDQAKNEIESVIGKEIEPIKIIKFNSGYSKEFWKNNVIALGLSSAFVEPLEASSIHNTIIQVAMFVHEFLHKDPNITLNKAHEIVYNRRITLLNEITVDFISLHYQGGREDSEFWRNIKDSGLITDKAKELVERSKYKIAGYTTFEGMYGSHSMPLANWILAGMGLITPAQALSDLEADGALLRTEKEYLNFYKSIVGI